MLLVCGMLANAMFPALAADTLVATDFKEESFAKTVDYFDYARAYATLHGIDTPAGFDNYRAYLYMTYINTKGLQLFYAGLQNVTFGGQAYFRMPMQSFIMHYRTDNRTRDVLLGSTFLMLLAFNETSDTIHADSPDISDTLWASFSMGLDLSALNATLPIFNSKTETFPLSHSDDKLQWSWGMKYTNLTAFWWSMSIDPFNPHFGNNWPIAITVYDELRFTYNLTINPTTNTTTLTENHVIGRMRDLLVGIPGLWVHYNNTGTYWLGARIGNDTIYDFIDDDGIKMSIVNFQTSILADRTTYSRTPSGQNVTDADSSISDTSIATYADDGEKICEANFGTKKTYQLYNYTDDPSETNYTTYNATARTARIGGFARQTGLFQYHMGLLKFLPLVVVNMYPQLYARAKETITNMSRANYLYLIAYPTYSGYRVEHDPVLTVYMSESPVLPPNWAGIFVVGAIAAASVVGIAVLVRRRKPKQSLSIPEPSIAT